MIINITDIPSLDIKNVLHYIIPNHQSIIVVN